MIRRKIVFKDNVIGKLFITPEFNGDKEGYEARGNCLDGCDKNWDEILEEFVGVETLDDFKEASERAQKHYHSFLGEEILPVKEMENIVDIKGCDYIYLIHDEKVSLVEDLNLLIG